MSANAADSAERGTTEIPLSFEDWAELSARLLNLDHEQRIDVFEERKIKPKDWDHCDEHYLRELATDVAADRRDRIDAYGKACADEMKRRETKEEAPPVAATENAPPAATIEEAPPVIGAPVEAPAVAVPTFLQDRPAPAPPAPQAVGATMDTFQLPSAMKGGAVPFRPSPQPSPFSVPSAAKEPRAASAGTGTLPLDGTLPLHGTLPLGTQLPAGPVIAAPAAPAFPRMPLPMYATFCAERAVWPDKVGEIQTKYGVRSDAARAALDQDWQARFEAHPRTRAEWERLVAEQRAKLAGQASR
jgi:hypothetical protein